MQEFKVGDIIWYIPGMVGDHLMLVRCTITEVYDYFRKQHPDAFLFYWIDEPVGHALGEDEIFLTKEEAIEELKERFKVCQEHQEYDSDICTNADLDVVRQGRLGFIISTWGDVPKDVKRPSLQDYPKKKQGIDWFNLSDLGIS